MCEWGGGAEVAATEARSPRHRSSRRPCRRAWTAAWSSPPAADTRRGTLGGSSRRFPSERRSCAGGRVGVAENDSKAAARDVGRWSLRGGRLLARGAPLGGGGVREQAHHQWRADVDSPASPESPGGLVCPVGRHERCSFGPKKKGGARRAHMGRAVRRSAVVEWVMWVGCASSCVRRVRACARSSGRGRAPKSDF